MPELPEVETVARQLHPIVAGRRLESIRIDDELLKNGRLPPHRGSRIKRVFRYGKQVLFELDRPGRSTNFLAVHLRMTGRLVAANAAPGPRKHLRAVLVLNRGAVEFIDTRRFGTMKFLDRQEHAAAVGAVDPTTAEFTPEKLKELIGKSKQPLKPWLLRQDRIVGLGNIYASEIAHLARVSPRRAVSGLSRDEIARIHDATRVVLKSAIENCGTTFSDFQDAYGVTGSYQAYLHVYDREGEPCTSCQTPIKRIVQQQRSTFFCPACVRRDSPRKR